MNQIIQPTPVRKTTHVKAPPARAFDVFTAGINTWWLKTHSINPTKSPIKEIVLEPYAGGQWMERGEDGSTCQWGKVLVWEPPTRLVLAWQIDAQHRFIPELVTEVEVRFTAEGDGTRVELEHRHLERLGEDGETLRKMVDSPNGWGRLLENFKENVV